ncbi:phage holin family protein [bacterium]|nr:phage holin family protein [bacterium]
MKKLILKILIFALAIFFAGYLIPGIAVDGFTTAMLAALVILAVNMFIKPVVKFIALPINFLTLGLFSIVINIALMYAVVYFMPGVNAEGFLPTLEMAGGLAILSAILNMFL